MSKRPFHLYFLALALFFAVAAQAAPQALQLHDEHHSAAGYLSLRLDPSSQLTIADVSAPAQAARFVPLAGNLRQGFTRSSAWLKITLARTQSAPGEWWMEVNSAILNEIEVYIPRPEGEFELRRAGDSYPQANKEFRYPSPVFRLTLPVNSETTLYIKIRTVKNMGSGISFWQPQAFSEAAADAQWGYGLYYGICLALILANLVFWGVTRDPLFCMYSVFSLMITLSSGGADGLLAQYVYPGFGGVNDFVIGIAVALTLPTGCFFLARALNMEMHFPRLRKFYVGGGAAVGGLGVLGVLLGFYTAVIPVVQLVILAYMPIPMVVAAWLSYQGERGAKLILVSYLVFFGAVVIRYLRNFGFLQTNFISDHGFQLGSLIYLFLMNVAVGWRYNDLREEKTQAQAALLLTEHEVLLKRRAEEEQKQFIAMVSHEFRTPLAIIGATTERLALLQGAEGSPESVGYTKIQRSVEWLTALLDEYLTEERLELLGHGLIPTPVSPMQLLTDAADKAREISTRHTIAVDTSGLPETFLLDPDLINLAINTLAENAVKHTPQGTLIHLQGASTPQGGIEFLISDNGPGIPEDEIPHIFNKFFRGRQSGRTYGSGLGLYLARNVVKMHGGELTAANRPNGGAEFRLWLPAAKDA